MGGNGPIDDVNEINIGKLSVIAKEKLPLKKYAMSLINISNFIYSVGGGGNNTDVLKECEKYSILDNKWTVIPQLTQLRKHCATIYLGGNNILIACAGMDNHPTSPNWDTFEKLDLVKMIKWEDITVENKFSARHGIHGISLGNNEALIYGSDKNETNSECYRVKMISDKLVLEKMADLSKGGKFISTMAPMIKGKYVYDFDELGNIHRIDTK